MQSPAMDSSSLFLITGIMAAGKSTVAQRLAERLPQSVHLRGDVFRRMIVSGRAEMGFELAPEAARQLELRYRIAATVARLYLAANFSVVYQDIIIGENLAEVIRDLNYQPLFVVVLCPDPGVVAARDAARAKTAYTTMSVAALEQVLRHQTPRLGWWLDTSDMTADETVDTILADHERARVIVPLVT